MYGQFSEAGGFDPGGLDRSDYEMADAASEAASQQPSVAPEEASALRLPPVGEEEVWLAALVEERGEVAVVRALLRVVPAQRVLSIVETLCKQEFGDECIVVYEDGQEGLWETTRGLLGPTTSTSPDLLLTSTTTSQSRGYLAYHPKRCWHCEPDTDFGRPDPVCTAVQVLGGLNVDFDDQKQQVDEYEALWGVSDAARAAARFYLYRKWVSVAYDRLGKGKRIRIPPCVVEYIRDRFRASGCKCALGGPLYACRDYVGHRDASGGGAGGAGDEN